MPGELHGCDHRWRRDFTVEDEQRLSPGERRVYGSRHSSSHEKRAALSSRAGTDIARLRRLRRLAARRGLAILATDKPPPKTPDGGYMLNDDETRQPILGGKPQPYCASLDEIEDYLDRMAEG